jgi:HPt (histidine-containing phosphotransfer) domain-containing protein
MGKQPVSSERYATLRRVLNGDTRRLLRLLDMFATTTRQDLIVFERARVAGDVAAIGSAAHRLKSACAQVDDTETTQALHALEDATFAGVFTPALAARAADAHARVSALVVAIEAYVMSDGTVDVR